MFATSTSFSLSALSGVLSINQRGRNAVEITSVSLTPVNPYAPTVVHAPEITADGAPLGTYDDPLLRSAADRPKSGAELLRELVEHFESEGQTIFDRSRDALRKVMAQALDMTVTDEVTLADLRDAAAAGGQDMMVQAADLFTAHENDFRTTLAGMQDRLNRLSSPPAPEETEALVRRAVGDLVEAKLVPERLRLEFEARRGVALLKLTGASEDMQQQAMALRRAGADATIAGKRRDMIGDMMRDYKAGRYVLTVTTRTAWAGQTLGVDTSRASGDVVTYVRQYDHYASASLSMDAARLSRTTLRTA